MQLAGLETAPELDLAALRQQALERSKSKATAVPSNRPPLVPELLKLPQISVDVLFDPDSSIIRPGSYRTLGRLADALTDPALLPYKFLIVGHTETGGRRDHNVAISQRRADAVRDTLVTMFKISPKRVQALGLGEEQLRDAARPTTAANRRIQVVSLGKMPEPSESPAPAPAKKPPRQEKSRRRENSDRLTDRAFVTSPRRGEAEAGAQRRLRVRGLHDAGLADRPPPHPDRIWRWIRPLPCGERCTIGLAKILRDATLSGRQGRRERRPSYQPGTRPGEVQGDYP